MVALNLLAASLLVAGVGSSLGLPSPMNVAVLPAIGSVKCFDDAHDPLHDVLVSPVTENASVLIGSEHALDVSVYFGSTLVFDELLAADSFIVFNYDSTVSDEPFSSYTTSDIGEAVDLAVVFVDLSVDAYSCTYVLPDLTYWVGGSGSYDIVFFPVAVGSSAYGYYGYLNYNNSVITVEALGYADLGADINPVDAITDGLTAIVPLGGALTDGFDAVFMDDGVLTAVGMFAFILMGVGISVGITKKCFNWVTGRHGM